MEPDEIIEYVRENVKKDDIFELAYNSDTVEIDLHKLKDEIVEIRHIPTGDPDDEENLVVIEAYDDDDIVKVEYDM